MISKTSSTELNWLRKQVCSGLFAIKQRCSASIATSTSLASLLCGPEPFEIQHFTMILAAVFLLCCQLGQSIPFTTAEREMHLWNQDTTEPTWFLTLTGQHGASEVDVVKITRECWQWAANQPNAFSAYGYLVVCQEPP